MDNFFVKHIQLLFNQPSFPELLQVGLGNENRGDNWNIFTGQMPFLEPNQHCQNAELK